MEDKGQFHLSGGDHRHHRHVGQYRAGTDFVPRWLSAFLVGWRVAAVPAFLAMPVARSVTLRIVGLINRSA
jgi:hypothetical protein